MGGVARKRWLAWLAVAGFVVIAILAFVFARPKSDEELIREARQLLAENRLHAADRIVRELFRRGANTDSVKLAAQLHLARSNGSVDDALGLLKKQAGDDTKSFIEANLIAGKIAIDAGRAAVAESQFRSVLLRDPNNLVANGELGMLFTLEGRRWEAKEHLFKLVRRRACSIEHLIMFGDLDQPFNFPIDVEKLRAAVPDDALPRLGLVRLEIALNDFDKAEAHLRAVIKSNPHLVEAHAWLGWILAQRGDDLAEWQKGSPPGADDHPLVWIARGIAASTQSHADEAVRCFWEAVRRDPNHRVANYRLGKLLAAQQKTEDAQAFLDRAATLERLNHSLTPILKNRYDRKLLARNLDKLGSVAKTMESLGRLWESAAWYDAVFSLDTNAVWAKRELDRLLPKLTNDLQQVADTADPTSRVNLSTYPLPEFVGLATSGNKTTGNAPSKGIRFTDMAEQSGLIFSYFNGHDPPLRHLKIYEFLGGGVGVLDYDADGWPDLYLTQGGTWPASESSKTYTDRLFRNLGDGTFVDVTFEAGLGDTSYSLGVAIGDHNSDGLPDIYVANLGPNRLYQNNGDGTFQDVSATAGLQHDSFTTSCLMADLNGDGLADIFDVNYVDHETGNIQRLCGSGDESQQLACIPSVFDARPDQLFLQLSDGRFSDRTEESKVRGKRGYGLGLVAVSFDNSDQLSLFVANDTSQNHFYVNETPTRGAEPRFSERGVICGLSADEDGKPQGCMGIAAGDVNQDGTLDFFVTNFENEANAMYSNEGGYFVDATRRTRLYDAGFNLVGFGTQFVDADLDGWLDLMVTNGHIDDYRTKTRSKKPSATFSISRLRPAQFKMPTQLFQNVGGKFSQVPAESMGTFFETHHLGRGMARVDWNRDGREDLAVSQLGEPAALLTNQTEQAGHFVAIQLKGVQSHRDAIGATVRLTVDGQTPVRQLTAGDGFQASNQRQIIFGLDENREVEKLHIRWPSGNEQEFKVVPTDREILIVEGCHDLIVLPSPN